MKKKTVTFLALVSLLIACIFAFSACGGREEEPEEVEYELVLPPTDMPEVEGDGEYSVDLEPLREAVEEDPLDKDARFTWMLALRRSGQTMDALEQARTLAEMDDENPYITVAWLNFAQMVLDEIPVDHSEKNRLVEEAMDGMWTALGYEPGSVPGHRALGRLALEAGDYDKALHHLSIALSVTEIGYELRMRMAEIYIEREDFEKAGAHLDAAESLAEEAEDSEALRKIRRMRSNIP